MSSMRTYSDRETDNMGYQLKNSQVTFRIDQKYSPDKVIQKGDNDGKEMKNWLNHSIITNL